MGAHEVLEHMEHAAHAGGGHGHAEPPKKTGMYIGLSMAVLGVLLAFCSALVGASRTELIKTMVEQSEAHAKYQAQNMKHRLAVVQLQSVHASIPTHGDAQIIDSEFAALAKQIPAAPATKDAPPSTSADTTALVLRGMRLATDHIVRILAPEKEDAMRLVSLVRKYDKEAEASKEWVEAFEESVHAHTEAAEHYERAQLAAEIGIVVASIALLMSSRKIWFAALALGAVSIVLVVMTYTSTHPHVVHGDAEIAAKGKAYTELRKGKSQRHDDEQFVDDVEKAFEK